jgi:hypothetical protein
MAITLFGCLPPLLVGCSLLAGVRGQVAPHPFRFGGGLGLTVLAALVGSTNFHLSFVRPRAYRQAHGSLAGYKRISGLSAIGTLLVLSGTAMAFGSIVCAALGLAVLVFDTGGLPWFCVAVWKDG